MLWLWYRGTSFRGWQRQVEGPTVQEVVEAALQSRGIAGGLAAAGRTDRGVHARQQVASLRVPPGTELAALAEGLGGRDWGCVAAAPASPGFHAQWSASSKEYRYRFCDGPAPASWAGSAWELPTEPRFEGRPVEADALGQVLAEATGTRDFSAFHASSSVRRPRTLSRVELCGGADGVWEVRLSGDGFGRYQVRALVGGAALVAAGCLPRPTWREALERATRFEGLLAPPQGLILWSVDFGAEGPFAGQRGERCPPEPPFIAPEPRALAGASGC